MRNITQSQLKRLFRYEPETGYFYRLFDSYNGKGRLRSKAGSIAGHKCKGYFRIHFKIADKKCYYSAHILAWFYMTGKWPKNEIDHIDLNKSNNAWKNLRLATHQQNACNMRRRINNTSGFKGVSSRIGGDKWYAHIRRNGKTFYIGTFDSKIAAAVAYDNEAKKLHGQFARPNF